MAPNLVKSGSMNSLSSLDLSNHIAPINFVASGTVATTAAFPPLIDIGTLIPPRGWNKQADARKDPLSNANKTTNSPSHIYSGLIEEEAQKAVSCAHIETNLISDSNRRKDLDQELCENDNEYDESYWVVPSTCCPAIENKVLSTGQVEKLLIEDALRRAKEIREQESVVEDNHPNNSYWEWQPEPVLESEKKSNMIASILHEELIRQRLSIDAITSLETSNKSDSNDSQIESASPVRVSVDYWCWNTEEEKVETEDIVAPHVHDPTHPNHAYWDFPAESKDPQAIKEKLINSILKEERIRNLLRAETAEDREVNFHRSRQGQSKIEYDCAPDHVLESVPSNYWDFDNKDQNNILSLLSQEQQEIINRILEEERQRHFLSTENIENNLRREIEDKEEKANILSSSNDYWQW